MTNELQMLVAELRHPIQRNERYYEPLCARAADELERLAKRVKELERECGRFENELFEARNSLAQSDMEPVERLKHVIENMGDEIERLAALAQSDAEPDEDRPLGFRTWDVPNPYAESPQCDDESTGEVYDKIKGHAVTQSNR